MKKVAFCTLGCKVNQYDTETLVRLFKGRGYEVVDVNDKADVYVINTCTVTSMADKKSRQAIRRSIRTNPKGIIVVTGCYAQTQPQKVMKIEGVDIVLGVSQRRQIVDMVEERLCHKAEQPISFLGPITEHYEDLAAEIMRERVRAYIKIQDGCEYFCTYCKIPYARGQMRSRPLDSILAEAERIVKAGVREIVLTGIHLGAYGKDRGGEVSLAKVITEIHSLPGVERIRLGSIEPMDITAELIKAIEVLPNVCQHLHIPLQSGEDGILKAMGRTYTTSEFRDLIHRVKDVLPECAITTDIIVGFPGEDEEAFEKACDFIEEMAFSRIHVFKFSKRAGTPAASFPNQVPSNVKEDRSARLITLGERLSLAYHRKFIGREIQVLIEKWQKGILDGLTSNYIRVRTPGSSKYVNEILPIRIKDADEDGLWGEIVHG